MPTFAHTSACPTAETLLTYAVNGLTAAERTAVEQHLSACDFCDAATRLLTRHGSALEPAPPAAKLPLCVLLLARQLPQSKQQTEPAWQPRAA
jgi:anti-sigma factor RsiW